MTIPRPGPGEALIIADGRVMIISRAELERLKQGDASDTPIASITVPEHQLDEALERVMRLLNENEE